MSGARRQRWRRALAVGSLFLLALMPASLSGAAAAGLQLELDVGAALFEAFGAENVRARVSWVGQQPRFEFQADLLRLPEPVGWIRDLRLDCPALELTAKRLHCAEARLSGRARGWALAAAALSFDWEREAGSIRFSAPWPGLFRARGRIDGLADARGVRLDLDLRGLQVPELVHSGLLPADLPVSVESGLVTVSGRVDTRGQVPAVRLDLGVSGLTFSDEAGLHAAEALVAGGQVGFGPGGWEVQLRFTEGAVFFEPWFLDFAEVGSMEVSASSVRFAQHAAFAWQAESARLRMGAHTEAQGKRLHYSGARLEQGELTWDSRRLDLAGTWLAQPVLQGTMLGRTRFKGALSGRLEVGAGRFRRLEVAWQELGLADDLGRFALSGSSGQISWQDEAPGPESFLSVAGGEVLGLPIGAFVARFLLEPAGFRLLEPLFVPVLDGGPSVEVLRVEIGPDGPVVEFEGGIRALSLELLTEVLGWPRLAGRLAGIIPRVYYDLDGLRVDGLLLVRVFDGEVVLRGLRVRNLFGVAPELEVSAEVRRMDLDLLTRAFDFGRIEGRLSGTVEDLLLVDWKPHRMRLSLATPVDRPGRRRISQRAVENLTAIGGGIQGALSVGFLRLFEDFAYRELGFHCDLVGVVCLASGVADGPDGSFVLVQGGGLPRIDVIGHNRRVDWPELIRRLNAVRAGGPPVVQ